MIAAAAAGMAVGELLPGLGHQGRSSPVICFVREEPVFGWSGDVMICSTENVVMFLTSRPRVLDEAKMTDVAEALAISLDARAATVPVTGSREHCAATADQEEGRPPRASVCHERPDAPSGSHRAAPGAFVTAAIALAFQFDLPPRSATSPSQRPSG